MNWKSRHGRFALIAITGSLALVVSVAILFNLPPPMPSAPTSVKPQRVAEPALDFEQREGVGWVFGRVMGVPGADKPLLPPQTPPVPFGGPFPN